MATTLLTSLSCYQTGIFGRSVLPDEPVGLPPNTTDGGRSAQSSGQRWTILVIVAVIARCNFSVARSAVRAKSCLSAGSSIGQPSDLRISQSDMVNQNAPPTGYEAMHAALRPRNSGVSKVLSGLGPRRRHKVATASVIARGIRSVIGVASARTVRTSSSCGNCDACNGSPRSGYLGGLRARSSSVPWSSDIRTHQAR